MMMADSPMCAPRAICRCWPNEKNAASSRYSTAVFLHTRHLFAAASFYLQIEPENQPEPLQRTGISPHDSSRRRQGAFLFLSRERPRLETNGHHVMFGFFALVLWRKDLLPSQAKYWTIP